MLIDWPPLIKMYLHEFEGNSKLRFKSWDLDLYLDLTYRLLLLLPLTTVLTVLHNLLIFCVNFIDQSKTDKCLVKVSFNEDSYSICSKELLYYVMCVRKIDTYVHKCTLRSAGWGMTIGQNATEWFCKNTQKCFVWNRLHAIELDQEQTADYSSLHMGYFIINK